MIDANKLKQVFSDNPDEGIKILEVICKDRNLYQNECYNLKTQWNDLNRNLNLGLQDRNTVLAEKNRLYYSFINLIDKLCNTNEAPPFFEQPARQPIQSSYMDIKTPNSKSNENIVGKIWSWMNYEDQKEVLLLIGAGIFILGSAIFKGC